MKNIKIILLVLFNIILFSGAFLFLTDLVSLDSHECSYSEYNIYTNTTGATRIFNHCFVPTNSVITRTEKCGFLGFVCRDVEPYLINSGGSVCFELKDGGLC